ncbi:MAG: rRNA maturation RNase YbeY [Rhodobacterales bacterium]|nr:MAG: rRNA maturation RNase YbeY [Rhodobacterales bacterium]
MLTDIQFQDPRWQQIQLDQIAETATTAALAHLNIPVDGAEIAILACDDAQIATLNADFRGKPTPTNVLSWPSEERATGAEGGTPLPPFDMELGDIAIAYDTCHREALEQSKPFPDHVTHLIVHGVLHLLGYDHIRDKDATLMEGIEVAILGKLGLPDPYRDYDTE